MTERQWNTLLPAWVYPEIDTCHREKREGRERLCLFLRFRLTVGKAEKQDTRSRQPSVCLNLPIFGQIFPKWEMHFLS